MNEPNASVEPVLVRLTAEFVDTCRDRIDDVDTKTSGLARQGSDYGDDLGAVDHTIHSIKGQAGTFGFPAIGRIADALEDFIEAIDTPAAENLLAIQKHLDAIRAIADGRENASLEEEIRTHLDRPAAAPSSIIAGPAGD